MDDVKRTRDNLKRKLGGLRESQSNSLKIFGTWVPDVNKAIESYARQGKFHKPPVGPLGKLSAHSIKNLSCVRQK